MCRQDGRGGERRRGGGGGGQGVGEGETLRFTLKKLFVRFIVEF